MASAGETPSLTLKQSRYRDEIERICASLEGPVCQIGARAQIVDTKALSWRARLQGKGFVGGDREPGDNVDAVFDVCDDIARIRSALEPALGGTALRGIVCAHLLEHLPRPWIAAGNIVSLLAPGGLVFVQVPWVQAFHAFPDDYWRMSLSGVAALFPGLDLVDAFWSGGSSDVSYRIVRDGRPVFGLEARTLEAHLFQVLLTAEDNRRFLAGLAERRLYLSRGYMPAMVVNYLGRKP